MITSKFKVTIQILPSLNLPKGKYTGGLDIFLMKERNICIYLYLKVG